jgi:hypothetical protein
MYPTMGRMVVYTMTEQDAEQINRRRTSGREIAERIKNNSLTVGDLDQDEVFPAMWPLGAQAHIGNAVTAGESYPCIIVRVWDDEFGTGKPGINGQVLLDANDQFWVKSAGEAPEATPGKWNWPVIFNR